MIIPKKILKVPPLLLILPIILLVILFFVYKRGISNQATSLKINPKRAKITQVRKGNIIQSLTLAGKVEAELYSVLRFQTPGRLAWVGVKEGDKVKKWQAIASLDKADLEKKFQKAMNEYLINRWNFEDTQDKYKLTKERFLLTDEIKRILERSQFSLNNSVLDVEITNLAVKYSTLTSPLNGIVTKIDQPIAGVSITPENATFTIIDPESIYFGSEIEEEDVTKVKIGQETTIFLDSFPEQTFPSKITYISFSPLQDKTSTVYRIKFDLNLPNSDLKYKIGMKGDAKIKLAEAEGVLLVPIEAIFEENGEQFVYVKTKGSRIERRTIKTGLDDTINIEVTENLSEGESVLYEES